MPGSGQLCLNLTWDDDITDLERLSLVISIQDISGNELYSVTKDTATEGEGISVLIPLEAGCYLVSVCVSDQDGRLDVGAADALRIIKGTTTTGTMHLQGSKPFGNPSLIFDNKVGSPMAFYLDYSPKTVSVGSSLTLSARCDSLDSSINTSSLVYQWFRDGVLLGSGSASTYLTTAKRGLHRYDVIVKSNVLGTMCGASLILNVT